LKLQTESLIHHQAFEKLLHGLILKGQWFVEGGGLEVPVDSISNAFTRLRSKLCPFVMHLQKSGGFPELKPTAYDGLKRDQHVN
jgi:hypothetical protein